MCWVQTCQSTLPRHSWLWGLCNSLPLVVLRRNVPPRVGTVRKCFSTFLTVQCCVSVQLLGSCPLSQNKFHPRVTFDLLYFANYWLELWFVIFMIRTKCQNMLRWSGQNANQKVGTDKMPTTEISPDKMPTFGWHYVRLAFCPVGILSAHRFFWLLIYWSLSLFITSWQVVSYLVRLYWRWQH